MIRHVVALCALVGAAGCGGGENANDLGLDLAASVDLAQIDGALAPVTQLASAQGRPTGIATSPDGTTVFWTSMSGTVSSAPTADADGSDGGGATTVLASGMSSPGPIVADAENVYWATQGDGQIWRVALAGGTPVVVATGAPNANALAVDATNLYFPLSNSGKVLKVARTATNAAPTAVVDAPASLVKSAVGIAVDSDTVYFADRDSGSILRAPLDGSMAATPTVMAKQQENPLRLRVDQQFVYWTAFDGGTISRLAKTSTSSVTPTLVVSGQSSPADFVVDGNFLYWTNTGDATIRKADLVHGGEAVEAMSPGGQPLALALAGNTLFWTDVGDGGVYGAVK